MLVLRDGPGPYKVVTEHLEYDETNERQVGEEELLHPAHILQVALVDCEVDSRLFIILIGRYLPSELLCVFLGIAELQREGSLLDEADVVLFLYPLLFVAAPVSIASFLVRV